MSGDLIAWIVAITFGAAVVGLGLRRNLADTTRDWLPRFTGGSEQATATPGPSDDRRRHRQLSPRQRRWSIYGYLLLSLCNAALAVLWADYRLFHAIIAIGFALSAVMVLKKSPSSLDGSTS